MQLRGEEDGALQRIGSAGYLIGALLLVVASLLLPRASDLSDVQAMQRTFAAQAVLPSLARGPLPSGMGMNGPLRL